MTRAAIHCRRSTDEQGASLNDQEEQGRSYCDARDWSVVAVYRESASGYKPGTPRPEFDRMMRDADAGKFDVLVVWRLNRLSRQEGDDSALAVVWRLRKLGVEVHSIEEPSSGNDLADDLQRLIASYQGSAESRTKSADVKRGKLRSITRHGVFHGGFAPYGYRRAGTMPSPENPKKHIVVYGEDPEAADIIREIFGRYLDGDSPHAIVNALNRRGIRPPRSTGVSANPQARRGEPMWQDPGIRSLLRNPLLAGFASYLGHRVKSCGCASPEVPDDWSDCDHPWTRSLNIPEIVDPSVWTRAQAKIRARANRALGGSGPSGVSETFLLMGLLFCDRCGERLACRRRRQTNRHDKYVCVGRRMVNCDMPTIRRDALDEAVRRHFLVNHVVDTEESVRRERDRLMTLRSSEVALVRDELRQVEAELAEMRGLSRRARTDYEVGELSAKIYSRLDDDYEARKIHAEKARDRLTVRLRQTEQSVPVEQLDVLLDRLSAARQIIAGVLDAATTPLLNGRLHDLFDRMIVGVEDGRVTVVPHLRDEGPLTRVLDFSDGTESQPPDIEIIGEPGGVVLTQVELLPEQGPNASSPW
jgi:site-specific DNA recombinase